MFAVVVRVKNKKTGKLRKIRMFPINDEAHVRNALARLGQSAPKATLKRLGVSVEAVEKRILRRARQLKMTELLKRYEKSSKETMAKKKEEKKVEAKVEEKVKSKVEEQPKAEETPKAEEKPKAEETPKAEEAPKTEEKVEKAEEKKDTPAEEPKVEQPKVEAKEEKKDEKVEDKESDTEKAKETSEEVTEEKAESVAKVEPEKADEKKDEKVEEKPVEKVEEKKEEKSDDKKDEKVDEKVSEKTDEKPTEEKVEKATEETREQKYAKGIRRLASKIRDLKKQLNLYKSNAKEIIKRREELGDFIADLTDEDILNDDKFARAKTEKENVLLRAQVEKGSENVGTKVKDDLYYAKRRKAIDDEAFKHLKK